MADKLCETIDGLQSKTVCNGPIRKAELSGHSERVLEAHSPAQSDDFPALTN